MRLCPGVLYLREPAGGKAREKFTKFPSWPCREDTRKAWENWDTARHRGRGVFEPVPPGSWKRGL